MIYELDLAGDTINQIRKIDPISRKIISEEKMTELHGYTTPMQHPNETIVPETFSLEQTVNLIRKTANI